MQDKMCEERKRENGLLNECLVATIHGNGRKSSGGVLVGRMVSACWLKRCQSPADGDLLRQLLLPQNVFKNRTRCERLGCLCWLSHFRPRMTSHLVLATRKYLQIARPCLTRKWFQHAIVALSDNVESQFTAITPKPPGNNSYDQLKKAVISRLSAS
ncbi:unnamed protein product [Rodentolepis nana]|uniref:Uncharacterized protein n=1 Tax=Rodentolepis nana TaxID=102285 RepID=A0A0R3TPX7_RODNA|nr:unnamed protein product [Rodentolepis nana]